MLVVDASVLYEVLVGGPAADDVRSRLAGDEDQAAPHAIDAEILGLIRRDHLRGRLDLTGATLAVDDLRTWPGTRFAHRPLLARAWELRGSVRSWDALYVSLAEALDASLLTLDARLARAPGIRCVIDVAR
jgi:predicted nucleic acid-binding protein